MALTDEQIGDAFALADGSPGALADSAKLVIAELLETRAQLAAIDRLYHDVMQDKAADIATIQRVHQAALDAHVRQLSDKTAEAVELQIELETAEAIIAADVEPAPVEPDPIIEEEIVPPEEP